MGATSGTISHTADLGLWVEADTAEELFEAAALALAELMFRGPRQGLVEWRPFEARAGEPAELLVEWLAEVVYLADGEDRLVAAAQVDELGPTRLAGRLGVIPLDPACHQPNEPVKAVTYHQARVSQEKGRWRAQVLLDV